MLEFPQDGVLPLCVETEASQNSLQVRSTHFLQKALLFLSLSLSISPFLSNHPLNKHTRKQGLAFSLRIKIAKAKRLPIPKFSGRNKQTRA